LFRSVAISANKLTVATVGRGGRSGGVTRLPPSVSADRGDVLATKRRRGRHSDNHDAATPTITTKHREGRISPGPFPFHALAGSRHRESGLMLGPECPGPAPGSAQRAGGNMAARHWE